MEKRIEKAARHLGQAVRIPTISNHDMAKMDLEVFSDFLAFLEKTYPLVYERLDFTLINGYSPVFCWRGSEKGKLPALLLAHYDVVPVLDEGWPHGGPFSGAVEDGRVWGRGALDDKSSIIGLMETLTWLLEEDFVPKRDLWIAFGFDEEVNGRNGAQQIVQWFRDAGIRFEFVLDEGGAVADGAMMGIRETLAVVGLAEKASASYEFTFTGEEGHSSTPPAHTSLGLMAEFIYKVERNPMPVRLTKTVEEMMETLAPYMPGIQSKILARPKLFFPILKSVLLKKKQTAAMLRTTVAFTMGESGSAPNVLPKEAKCTANFRILQGDSTADVLAHIKRVSGMDYKVRPIATEEPSQTASTTSAAFAHLRKMIEKAFPEAVVMPYLMTGGTDSRYYEDLSSDVYRFQPLRLTEEEMDLVHGTGEYLTVENLGRMISFYKEFIETLD